MDYTQQFLTVMTPATSTGSLALEIDTYDLLNNVTFTLNVSGITGTEQPFDLANKVQSQLTTYFYQNNMQFQNVPPLLPTSTVPPFLAFPDQPMSPMFNTTWTEHCVCVMGQCSFRLQVTNNTIGSTILVDEHPTLITYQDSQTYGEDVLWEDAYGNILSPTQVINKLSKSSSKLTRWLRNNIVLSTYIYYEITTGTKSIFLPKTPVRDFFAPVVRRPIIFAVQQVTANATVKQNYELDRTRGELTYRFAQDFVYNVEPFDDQNECMTAYVAGYQKIPLTVKEYVIKLATLIHDQEFNQMKAEGSTVTFKSTEDILKSWAAFLGPYFLP